jgi:hypothetical protein
MKQVLINVIHNTKTEPDENYTSSSSSSLQSTSPSSSNSALAWSLALGSCVAAASYDYIDSGTSDDIQHNLEQEFQDILTSMASSASSASSYPPPPPSPSPPSSNKASRPDVGQDTKESVSVSRPGHGSLSVPSSMSPPVSTSSPVIVGFVAALTEQLFQQQEDNKHWIYEDKLTNIETETSTGTGTLKCSPHDILVAVGRGALSAVRTGVLHVDEVAAVARCLAEASDGSGGLDDDDENDDVISVAIKVYLSEILFLELSFTG